MRCERCGSENADSARFCGQCGHGPLSAQPDLGAPAPAAPAEQVAPAHGGGPPADERRLVTVLFADLAGFTGLAENRDPEEVQDLLNSCFDTLVPCVERYEGTIDKFMGDALMALFGAPVAHENDAERAIRAALDIRVALAEFNRGRGLELAVHQGISSGLVLAGSLGGGRRHDYSVVGDTVNLASRLEDMSAPGEILIGPDTYALAGALFETEEAGTVSVRGRVEPIRIRRVLREAPSGAVRALSRLRAPMVGREKELEAFLDALRAARDGRGSVLWVCGEAGLGKSRLIAEARKMAGPEFVWLEGQAASLGQNISYRPFRQMIEADLGCSPDDDRSERLAALERRVAHLIPGARRHELDFLAALLGVETAEHRDWLSSFDEPVFRPRLHAAIAAYLGGLARERPLALVFEDLHWVDGFSAAAIEALLPIVESAPVLICLVSRPDLEASHFRPERLTTVVDRRFAQIRLSPLGRAESRELVVELLGTAQVPPGLQQIIERRAEGNPFYIQEILYALVTSGQIAEEGSGGWRLKAGSDLAVPDTLKGIIASRVDRLPAEARETIRVCSVVGRSLRLSVVAAAMGRSREETAGRLAHLEDTEMVQAVAGCVEPEFAFRHALMQEAVYETIPLRERRILHERVAGVLESVAEGLDESSDLLAYHYSKAEKWDRAQEYLFRAGEGARLLGAPDASRYYREALEAILRNWRGQPDDEERTGSPDWFESGLVPLLHQSRLTEIFDPLRDFYARMTEAFGQDDRRTLAAAELLGCAHGQQWMFPECIALLESTLRLREATDGADEPSLARMMPWLASAYVHVGRHEEAERLLTRGIELQRTSAVADCDTLAALYTTLCFCKASQGKLWERKVLMEEALSIPGLDKSPVYCGLLTNLCDAEVELGLAAEAELHGRLGSGMGVDYVRAQSRGNLGFALRTFGRYGEARDELEHVRDTFDDLGRGWDLGWALAELAECQLQLGELDAAAGSALRAVNLLEREGEYSARDLGQVFWTLAGIELARDNLAEAERLLDEALPLLCSESAIGRTFWEAEGLFRRAQLHLKKGCRDDAERDASRAFELLAALGGEQHARRTLMLAEWERMTAAP